MRKIWILKQLFYRSDTEKEIEEGEATGDEEGELHPLVTVTKIDPDEIPEVGGSLSQNVIYIRFIFVYF